MCRHQREVKVRILTEAPPPPLPTPIESGGIPLLSTPLSREKDTPPTSGSGYHWQLQKHPFPGLFVKFSQDYAPKIPPFPRKLEHACGPLMHSSGGRAEGTSLLPPNSGHFLGNMNVREKKCVPTLSVKRNLSLLQSDTH